MSNIHAFLPPSLVLALGDLHVLSDAFDLAMLELPRGHDAALEEKIGRAIIDVALAGERDVVSLCDRALARVLTPAETSVPPWTEPRVEAVKLVA
jgi:hypothetical protein